MDGEGIWLGAGLERGEPQWRPWQWLQLARSWFGLVGWRRIATGHASHEAAACTRGSCSCKGGSSRCNAVGPFELISCDSAEQRRESLLLSSGRALGRPPARCPNACELHSNELKFRFETTREPSGQRRARHLFRFGWAAQPGGSAWARCSLRNSGELGAKSIGRGQSAARSTRSSSLAS